MGLHIVDGDLERLRDQVDWVGEDLGGLEAGVVGRVASGVPGARACGACAAASGAVGDWLSGLEGRYGAVSAGVRAMAAAYRADDDAQAGAWSVPVWGRAVLPVVPPPGRLLVRWRTPPGCPRPLSGCVRGWGETRWSRGLTCACGTRGCWRRRSTTCGP